MWTCFRPTSFRLDIDINDDEEVVSPSVLVRLTEFQAGQEGQLPSPYLQAQSECAQQTSALAQVAARTMRFMDQLEKHLAQVNDDDAHARSSRASRSPCLALPPEEQAELLINRMAARQAWLLTAVRKLAKDSAEGQRSLADLDVISSMQEDTLKQLALMHRETAQLKAENARLRGKIYELEDRLASASSAVEATTFPEASERTHGACVVTKLQDDSLSRAEAELITTSVDTTATEQKMIPTGYAAAAQRITKEICLPLPACSKGLGRLTLVLTDASTDPHSLNTAPYTIEEASSAALDLTGASSVMSDWAASVSQLGELGELGDHIKIYQGGSWPLPDIANSPPAGNKKRMTLLNVVWNPRRWLKLA